MSAEKKREKECWACSKPLVKEYSRKCIHCEAYQRGWRKHFSFSIPVLSLIVAIISSAAIAVPVFLDALRSDNSKILVNYLSYKDLTFSILVANTGKRHGVIKRAGLIIPKSDLGLPDNSALPVYALLPREQEERTAILAPGEAKILHLNKPHGKKLLRVGTRQWQENEENEQTEIEIDIINFDGSFESKRIQVGQIGSLIINDHDSQINGGMTSKN
jgi:hypothetical protein